MFFAEVVGVLEEGNALAFVDEMRWTLEVGVVSLLPAVGHPQAVVVPRPAPAWGRGTSR